MLSWYILQHEQDGTYTGPKLNGFAVGNGCTGSSIGVCSSYFSFLCQGQYYIYKYMEGLSFFSQDLKDAIDAECDWDACQQPTARIKVLSHTCINLLNAASYMLGEEINIYNVYGRCVENACPGPNEDTRSNPSGRVGRKRVNALNIRKEIESSKDRGEKYDGRYNYLFDTKTVQHIERTNTHEFTSEAYVRTNDDDINSPPYYHYYNEGPSGCMDSYAATTYLMNPEVQAAIHVNPIDYCWAICNNVKGFEYDITAENLPRDVYPTLIANMNVLIFNGDWDACVPYTGGIYVIMWDVSIVFLRTYSHLSPSHLSHSQTMRLGQKAWDSMRASHGIPGYTPTYSTLRR